MFDSEPFDIEPMDHNLNNPFWRWDDYMGVSGGMVHFTHGSYRLQDIARVLYPNDDSRQSWFILKYSQD